MCATVPFDKLPTENKLVTRASVREAWSKAKAHMMAEEKVLAEKPNFQNQFGPFSPNPV